MKDWSDSGPVCGSRPAFIRELLMFLRTNKSTHSHLLTHLQRQVNILLKTEKSREGQRQRTGRESYLIALPGCYRIPLFTNHV